MPDIDIIRLVRAARGLEAGGFNNAAKLMWAAVFAEEIRASSQQAIPRGAELDAEMGAIIDLLKAAGWRDELLDALDKGRLAVREDRTIPYADIPRVFVSRTCGEIILGDPPERSSCDDHPLGLREFLPIYYLDFLSPAEVLAALTAAPETIEAQLRGLSAEQLLIAPAPGEWNMRELLWHLLQAQELVAVRVQKMLAEDNPALEAVAVWAMQDRDVLSPGDILERYRASREDMLARLKAMSPADWWRSGQHREWGAQTILSQATYFARHEMSHLPQFAQIRRAAETN